MIYHFFQFVKKKLDERRAELAIAVLSGTTIQSMEDYRFFTGKLKGIEEAMSLLAEAYRILADSKDEEESNENKGS